MTFPIFFIYLWPIEESGLLKKMLYSKFWETNAKLKNGTPSQESCNLSFTLKAVKASNVAKGK
jgi:hypothetical protein